MWNVDVKPLIRWVGGKRKLLDTLLTRFPTFEGRFIEPFAGGLSVTLAMIDRQPLVSDANGELINFYTTLRDEPDGVVRTFRSLRNDEETFYKVRDLDREASFGELDRVKRASRFLYLNKAAFNGLWRVNRSGYNNVPFARRKELMLDDDHVRAFVEAIRNVEFECCDYEVTLDRAQPHDFVYLDPPYVPATSKGSFTAYTKDGFDHERLARACEKLYERGVKFVLSNSDCDATRTLWSGFKHERVEVNHSVAAKGTSRGRVGEVIIS